MGLRRFTLSSMTSLHPRLNAGCGKR